ncbi:transglutaminase-like domain-containing protein [Mycoplasma leonicaptivi]|uniref:transglutaminase-like domain-containing protein n=1 Tax=Mycoplasma leonicaptivi TaxID=36742 RepID=UPI00047FDFB8|nr:transglutaminase-like domain-containing protein [Mycoplasma leonicaptivi]
MNKNKFKKIFSIVSVTPLLIALGCNFQEKDKIKSKIQEENTEASGKNSNGLEIKPMQIERDQKNQENKTNIVSETKSNNSLNNIEEIKENDKNSNNIKLIANNEPDNYNSIENESENSNSKHNYSISDYDQQIKELYPDDIDYDKNPVTNNKSNTQNIDWNNSINDEKNVFFNLKEQQKIVLTKRISKIGDERSEINELKSLFNKLVTSNDIFAYDVRQLNFDARLMGKALVEWYKESWSDNLFLELSRQMIYFETETEDGDQRLNQPSKKIYNDKFIRLHKIQKKQTSIVWDWITEGNEKRNLINFISQGIAQITPDMSDLDKVFAITRYVCDYFIYEDVSAYYDLYYGINHREGVCQQYGTAIAMLLNIVGVQAISKPTGNALHQYAIAYFDPKGGNDKKWYRVDGAFIDEGRRTQENIKDIFTHKKLRNWQNTFQAIHEGEGLYEQMGYDVSYYLPWDSLFKDKLNATENFYSKSFLSIDEKWKMITTSRFQTRYFLSNGYWYSITNRNLEEDPNSNQTQYINKYLYRVKSNSNQLEIVKKNDQILIADDKIAPLINLLTTQPRTYQHNDYLYYLNKHSDKKLYIDIIDLNSQTKVKEVLFTDILDNFNLNEDFSIRDFDFDMLKNKITVKLNGTIKDLNSYKNHEFIIDLNNKNISSKLLLNKEVKTKQDLWRYKNKVRAILGTYMFSKTPKILHLNQSLRDEFQLINKNIDDNYLNLTQAQILSYAKQLKSIVNKIPKSKWIIEHKKLFIERNLPNILEISEIKVEIKIRP